MTSQPSAAVGKVRLFGQQVGWMLAALTALHIAAVLVLWRDSWFTVDSWEFFARPALSAETLLIPHQDHLQPLQAIVFATLKPLVGISYFPLYLVPRLLVYPILAAVVAFIVLGRTGNRTTATLTGAFVLFMSNTSWNVDAQFGGPMSIAAFLLAAWIVSEQRLPTIPVRVGVSALLILSIVAGSTGLLGALLVLGVTVVVRSRWPYIVSSVAPIALYLVWAAAYRETGVGGSLPTVTETLALGWTIAQDSARLISGLKFAITGVLAIPIALSLSLLAVRRRLKLFDFLAIATAFLYAGAVVYSRFTNGFANPHHPRFSHNVVLLTVATVVSALSLLSVRRLRTAAPLVHALLVISIVGNSYFFIQEARSQADFQQRGRVLGNELASLINEGEPAAVRDRQLNRLLGPWFDVDLVESLVPSFWIPDISSDRSTSEQARGNLRISVWPAGQVSGTVQVEGVSSGEQCLFVEESQTVELRLTSRTVIEIQSEEPTTLSWVSQDDFGSGRQTSARRLFAFPWKKGRVFATLVGTPASNVTLTPNESGIEVCDVSPLDP